MAELDSQPKSIQSLYTWFAEGKLWVNRRYQRKLVWTLEEKQKLVESALRKYPIPAILLAEREEGGYEVIDGLQRIHTLMAFIEMGFAGPDGRYFAVSDFTSANTRAKQGIFKVIGGVPTLSSRETGTFLDYSLAVSVMREATTAEIDDVFGRINTYGHRLSEQERRQAGVQNTFSSLVRELACEIRGDVSKNEIGLVDMPSISIDMPLTRHGYGVAAKEVFWVEQGILRSTDLRDSMDEQCVADIAASIVGGALIPRAKDALDAVYDDGSDESNRIEAALQAYGASKISAEFKYILDEIRKIVDDGKLRDVLYRNRTSNPFPAFFALLFVAFHEVLIGDGKIISNYPSLRAALDGLSTRVTTSRTSVAERRQNINQIKGLIAPFVVPGDHKDLYGDHTSFDIDDAIRRSEIETAHYELKQGVLNLDGSNAVDDGVLTKIVNTICAIANNGKSRAGTIFIGVADKETDVKRIKHLHGTEARPVGRRKVVGVRREADALNESMESYVTRIRDSILNSELSEPLKGSVLASLTFSEYFGMGVVVIRIPEQAQVSTVGQHVYIRSGDQTVEVSGVNLLNLPQRFQ